MYMNPQPPPSEMYGPPPQSEANTAYGAPQMPYGPAFPPPNAPLPPPYPGWPYFPPPTPPQESRTKYWVIIAVIGIFLVLAFAGCGLFYYAILSQVNSAVTTTFVSTPPSLSGNEATLAVTTYYQFIREQEYSLAYTELASNALIKGQTMTPDTFTQLAQSADAQQGKVLSFSVLAAPNDPTSFTVTVQRNSSYDVHITVTQDSSGLYKISDADGI